MFILSGVFFLFLPLPCCPVLMQYNTTDALEIFLPAAGLDACTTGEPTLSN